MAIDVGTERAGLDVLQAGDDGVQRNHTQIFRHGASWFAILIGDTETGNDPHIMELTGGDWDFALDSTGTRAAGTDIEVNTSSGANIDVVYREDLATLYVICWGDDSAKQTVSVYTYASGTGRFTLDTRTAGSTSFIPAVGASNEGQWGTAVDENGVIVIVYVDDLDDSLTIATSEDNGATWNEADLLGSGVKAGSNANVDIIARELGGTAQLQVMYMTTGGAYRELIIAQSATPADYRTYANWTDTAISATPTGAEENHNHLVDGGSYKFLVRKSNTDYIYLHWNSGSGWNELEVSSGATVAKSRPQGMWNSDAGKLYIFYTVKDTDVAYPDDLFYKVFDTADDTLGDEQTAIGYTPNEEVRTPRTPRQAVTEASGGLVVAEHGTLNQFAYNLLTMEGAPAGGGGLPTGSMSMLKVGA